MQRDPNPRSPGEQPDYAYGYGYAPSATPVAEDGLSLGQLAGVARRNLPLIAGCAVLGALLAAEFAYRQERLYTASAELLVEAQTNRFLENAVIDAEVETPTSTTAFETQLRLVTSREVLLATARDLGLDRDPVFNADLPQPESGRVGPLGALYALLPSKARAGLDGAFDQVGSWLGGGAAADPIEPAAGPPARPIVNSAADPADAPGSTIARPTNAKPAIASPAIAGLDLAEPGDLEALHRRLAREFAATATASAPGEERGDQREPTQRVAASDAPSAVGRPAARTIAPAAGAPPRSEIERDQATPLPAMTARVAHDFADPGMRALNRAADALERRVDAVRAGRSQILTIDVSLPDPERAAAIANAVAANYIAILSDRRHETSREADRWLDQRLAVLGGDVRAAERRIERFRAANQLGVRDGSSFAEQQLSRLGEQLIQARADANAIESRVRFIRSLIGRGEGLDSVEEVANSKAVQGLREQQRDIEREIATLSLELGVRHPRIIALEREITEIADKVLQEAAFIAANMETEGRIARAQVREIESEIESAKTDAEVDQDAAVQLAELEREAEAVRAVYVDFLNRSAELRGRGDLEEAEAKIVAAATPPERPSSKPPLLFVGLGFVFASGGGFFLAFLRERLDQRVRDPRVIEAKLQIACLGATPLIAKEDVAAELIERPHSHYAEAARAALSTYLLSSERQTPRALALTSTAPGEGKSTLSASLALTAARTRFKTLLVDADFRRPSVARQMKVEPRAGLLAYLEGGAGFDEIIEHVERPALDVIAGALDPERSIELITEKRLADFVAEAKERYDLVIFDSPPVLGLADTNIVASVVDDVIYVIEWNEMAMAAIETGLGSLRAVEADIAGAILSKVDMEKQKRYAYNDFAHHYDRYKNYYTD